MASKRVRSCRVSEILNEIDREAPFSAAEAWDNVGLLVGSAHWRVSKAVVALDASDAVLARSRGGVCVVHHPLIFPKGRGPSSVVDRKDGGGRVFRALEGHTAVIASHTNFDRCALAAPLGVARALRIEPHGRLTAPSGEGPLLQKLVVFVPEAHAEAVRAAMAEAGAGQIGRYDSCAFFTSGVGTFRGGEGSRPRVGKVGRLERVPEIRLETVVPVGLEGRVLKRLLEVHPYEEVAYDLYPLSQSVEVRGLPFGLGYGVFGDLKRSERLEAVVARAQTAFKTRGGLLTARTGGRAVRRIAWTPGKASSLVSSALRARADLLITGEVGYHVAQDAARAGLSVLELGHAQSEWFFLETTAKWLKSLGLSVRVHSERHQRFT